MDSGARIRWLLIALIIARTGYSWVLVATTVLTLVGLEHVVGLSPELGTSIAALSPLMLTVWLVYLVGYTYCGVLVWQRRARAVWVGMIAAVLDIANWALGVLDERLFQVGQMLEFGAYGLRDMVFNLAAVMIVAGLLYLRREGELTR